MPSPTSALVFFTLLLASKCLFVWAILATGALEYGSHTLISLASEGHQALRCPSDNSSPFSKDCSDASGPSKPLSPAPSTGAATSIMALPTKKLLGGDSTYTGPASPHSFSQPSQNMPAGQRSAFVMGDSLFARSWVFAPSSLTNSDGLGPLFNARACQSCHLKDGRGHLPTGPTDTATSALVKLAVLNSGPSDPDSTAHSPGSTSVSFPMHTITGDPVYGHQFHDHAMPSLPAEGTLVIRWQPSQMFSEDMAALNLSSRLSSGPYPTVLSFSEAQSPHHQLWRPYPTFTNLGYGPLHPHVQKSLMVAPPMIGLGLLEAIPPSAIISRADPMDRDGDGISGRVSWLPTFSSPNPPPDPGSKHPGAPEESHRYRLGRFGWKASQPTLMDQNLGAFFNDLGMTSSRHGAPHGDCTQPQQEQCYKLAIAGATKSSSSPLVALDSAALDSATENTAAQRDISPEIAEMILFYTRSLAPPQQRIPQDPIARERVFIGEKIFHQIQCASCHTPSHITSRDYPLAHLREQKIYPFTDMLLHDLGSGLDDGLSTPHASSSEWRTTPLWGLGLTQLISPEAGFLHDGRAETIEEAILWHGGEAANSRGQYLSLSSSDQVALISFLHSL